ncbi:MAG TPA: energy transducer TonB, partial [Bacteroidales bacterium]|nr:energy transducer TonB [Bacteroidales bacterium]
LKSPRSFPVAMKRCLIILRKTCGYPPQARQVAAQGVVYLTFVIHEDGSIGDVMVLRGVHRLLDEEAVHVVSAMPSWVPGKQRGKPVRVQFTMPVKFALK